MSLNATGSGHCSSSPACLIIGPLFCLTPLTAIIVLGWLTRFSGKVSARRLVALGGTTTSALAGTTTWITDSSADGLMGRLFGSLLKNVRAGLTTAFALILATFPFTLLWLLSWWAGWENSFNKGYEQSWVGPTVGLIGVFIAVNVFSYLPMALAHQAHEQRWQVLLDVKRLRGLIANAGWRYMLLCAAWVIAALPLFAAKGLPVFIEAIHPGFADLPLERQIEIGNAIKLLAAAYIFFTLVILRWLAARLYARALTRPGTSWRLTRLLRALLARVICFGLVAQIYVGQFLNHDWFYWLNHPLILLPWQH